MVVSNGGSESSSASVGVDLVLRGLGELYVFLAQHQPSQVLQHRPDSVGDLPLGQRGHSLLVNLFDIMTREHRKS